MTFSRLPRVATVAAFALAFAPGVAHAQRTAQDIESARQLYNQGIELRDKGDLKGALDKFRAAHALGNTPLTGIELCRTYAALKQPVEAREVCLGVARIPPLAQETPRSQEARAEAGKIAEAEKPKIGGLRLKVSGIPPGREALVLVDGTAVPTAALGEARAINPGVHQITAKVGSGEETKATVETKEGETRDVELTVVAPAEPVTPPPGTPGAQPAKDEKKMSPIALGSFVLAGVAGVIGVSAGIIAMNGESDLDKKCINKQCGEELHDDLESAESAGTVSTVAFVIAGIALGGGIIATLTASKSSTASVPARTADRSRVPPKSTFTPLLGPGGAGFRGTF